MMDDDGLQQDAHDLLKNATPKRMDELAKP